MFIAGKYPWVPERDRDGAWNAGEPNRDVGEGECSRGRGGGEAAGGVLKFAVSACNRHLELNVKGRSGISAGSPLAAEGERDAGVGRGWPDGLGGNTRRELSTNCRSSIFL